MATVFDFRSRTNRPAPSAAAAAGRRPERRVCTVTELTVAHPRAARDASFFEVWVEGELSNCRVWNTGHLYFTLKDAGAQMQGGHVPLRRCAI